jgi:hypothetical protein
MTIIDDDAVVTQHEFLSAAQCQQIQDRVMALEPRWIRRGNTFFTLGAASYIDAPNQLGEYLRCAALHNPVLKSGFDDLHQLLAQFLSSLLGGTVFFDETYSLPGFHIFLHDGYERTKEDVARSAHFDLQWMSAIPEWRGTRTLSFTLPIELPSGGSSMEIWPLRYEDAHKKGVGPKQYAAEHQAQRATYAVGRMVINDGKMLHAIGRGAIPNPVGRRITLQGHGIETPDGWMLYW